MEKKLLVATLKVIDENSRIRIRIRIRIHTEYESESGPLVRVTDPRNRTKMSRIRNTDIPFQNKPDI
jgi:hypothetical protein